MKIIKKFDFVTLLFFLLFLMGCSTTVPTNHVPTINSIPITSTLLGEPYTYEVNAIDADGDILAYSLTSSPTGMTIDSVTGVISWIPTMEGNYNVNLEVSDGELSDTQSFTLSVSLSMVETTLSPPTNVGASDTYAGKVRITWDSVSGATYYQVYRANSPFSTITPISSWQTGTSYDDTTVLPGVTYWYWIKAASSSSGDNASEYSSIATGNSLGLSVILSPPTNVTASYIPGSYVTSGTIQITWDSVSGATHYQVYRTSGTSDSTKIPISGWQTETTYDDNIVILYTRYWYWVKAALNSSGDNASEYSDYDVAIVWDY
jgi:hypothetical protein